MKNIKVKTAISLKGVYRNYITILGIVFTIVIPQKSFSQINLIPNNSFEDTVNCPPNLSGFDGAEIYSLQNWFPAGQSPDFFHSCATNQASNPLSGFGYQMPKQGEGYVGFYTILRSNFFPDYREYIGVQLTQNLNIGTKYYFKGYVSAAFGGLQFIHFFSDKVGVKLSNTFYESQINPLVPDNNANGYIDTIISDTTNWLPFQFSFIADSTYQYLYLGNFFDGANTDSIQAFNTVNGQGAYYFIDALCLSTDSNYCETILSSIESKSEPFIIYPNPTSQFLFIKNLKYSMLIHIYDLIGREVFSIQLNKEDSSLDISSLPAGNYFIVADNPKFKSIIFQKI